GGAEEPEVLCELHETRRLVFTWDAQGAVEIFAILESARPVRLRETVRIDLVFGPLPHRLSSRFLRNGGFESTQVIACERKHMPGLEVPSRRGPGRGHEDLFEQFRGNGLIQIRAQRS